MRKELEGLDRCPMCGHKLHKALTPERLAANLENLKKRKSKGGRPKGSTTTPPDNENPPGE